MNTNRISLGIIGIRVTKIQIERGSFGPKSRHKLTTLAPECGFQSAACALELKGNPVRNRSCSRNCKQCPSSIYGMPLPTIHTTVLLKGREGRQPDASQETCLIQHTSINFREKGLTTDRLIGVPCYSTQTMHYDCHWGVFALCCLFHTEMAAQADSVSVRKLDEVVVTDSRFPLGREKSGKTVIRLDREDLEAYRGESVAAILNLQAGFEISGSRGRPGEVLGVFARGGRGRQVVIYLDGVRITDPSSFSQEYDMRLLSADDFESIEILKGASSVLYGANAATAVIQLRTKRAAKRPLAISAGSTIGTANTSEESALDLGNFTQFARLHGSNGALSYQAAISNSYANGLSSLAAGSEPDPFSNTSADLSLGYALESGMKFRLSANQTRLRSAYDDSFNGVDADFEFRTNQERIALQWEWAGKKDKLEFNTGYTDYDSESRSDFPSGFNGNSWASDFIYKREFGDQVQALAGFQLIRDEAELEAPEFFTLADPYLNVVWNAPSGFNLNTGGRLNIHSAYGIQGVYNLNPSFTYGLKNGYIKAMASLATAYITPSLVQLYGAFGANPELKPERNRSLEGGLEVRKESWTASLLYFNRREEQAVIFDNSAFVYFNSEDAIRVSGFEVLAAWKLSAQTDISLNYTYTERQGDNAIRIPKHKLNAEFKTRLLLQTDLSVRYQYTGSRTDTDFTTFEDVTLDPYSLLGLRLSRRFCKGKLNAFVAADNLLNEQFTEVLGFQTPGRNVTFGWQLDL